MKKFYIDEKEIDTVGEFLDIFADNLFAYTDYITEISGVKLDIIFEEMSNLLQVIEDGGKYGFNGITYKVE